ncbi:MAG TPA: hypothetical protein VF523_00015, partial [Burkholderiales bacterium]
RSGPGSVAPLAGRGGAEEGAGTPAANGSGEAAWTGSGRLRTGGGGATNRACMTPGRATRALPAGKDHP